MKKMIVVVVLAFWGGAAWCQSQRQDNTLDTSKNVPVNLTTAFRMHYDDLFKRNTDGSISPTRLLEINGEMVNPSIKIAAGETYGGINISAYGGHDLMVDTAKGVVIVRKFLK